MNFKEFLVLLNDPNELDKAIDFIKPDIKLVDEYSKLLKGGKLDNVEALMKASQVLQGVYNDLEVLLEIADAEKTNRETRTYETLRMDAVNSQEKFVDAVASKQASLAVEHYRKMRNILQGYVNACEKSIMTILANLKKKDKVGYDPESVQ